MDEPRADDPDADDPDADDADADADADTVRIDHDAARYGDSFADVYDEWYGALNGGDAAVELLANLAGDGRVLELGIGTGRLALPLAERGVRVVGLDSSAAMLERLRDKPGSDLIEVHHGDMATDVPPGPFSVVFVAVNTLFNLTTDRAQRSCAAAVAAQLAPGGRFVIEAFVPGGDSGGDHVEVRALTDDRVVLSVTRTDTAAQLTRGNDIELTEAGGVRLRPWSIRWATPAQLDAVCADSGLVLENRYGGWSMETFDADSIEHVSIYRRPNP